METQLKNSTNRPEVDYQQINSDALHIMMDMEVLVRHMTSEEYQQLDTEHVTPMLTELLLKKLNDAQEILSVE
ncbi:MAG: hypothetical protein AWU57_457 [Marinobacter sp. T13-3]|nr:MAG: hypothetical protein AWU57_457 [Marinobacter sp. T13-3]